MNNGLVHDITLCDLTWGCEFMCPLHTVRAIMAVIHEKRMRSLLMRQPPSAHDSVHTRSITLVQLCGVDTVRLCHGCAHTQGPHRTTAAPRPRAPPLPPTITSVARMLCVVECTTVLYLKAAHGDVPTITTDGPEASDSG